MQTLIKNGQYKVIEVLYSIDGYEACLCIDVEKNDNYRSYVANIYSGKEYIKDLLPHLFQLSKSNCKSFKELSPTLNTINLTFDYYDGTDVNSYFEKIPKFDIELRLFYMGLVLEEYLKLEIMPRQLLWTTLRPQNFVINPLKETVNVNCIIIPDPYRPEEPIKERLISMIETILPENRYLPEIIIDFKQKIKDDFSGMVSLFSEWKEINLTAIEQYHILCNESWFHYTMRRIKNRFKRKFKRKKNTA